MSVKLMASVWEIELPAAEQLVMLALADHADHNGEHVYPGVDLLAWKTGYSVRQVQRILKSLEEKQLIEAKLKLKRGGRGHITEYVIHIEKGDKKTPFRKGDNMTPIKPVKGDKLSLKGDILTQERVTSATVKGDIPGKKVGHEPALQAESSPPNRHITVNKNHQGKSECDPSDEAYQLAEHFRTLISQRLPKATIATSPQSFQQAIQDMRRLLAERRLTFLEVREVIDFSQANAWFKKKILSSSLLVQHLDELMAGASEQYASNGSASPTRRHRQFV